MSGKSIATDNRSGAKLSKDRKYRYRLWRAWNIDKPAVAFIMLNPSTADETDDDPTIRRCLGYAKDWGYGSLIVGNLFAYRTSNPSGLRKCKDPIGPENNERLQSICNDSDLVVAAWGVNGSLYGREDEVMDNLDADFYALNTTKDGHPNHPLYQPSDADPVPFNK